MMAGERQSVITTFFAIRMSTAGIMIHQKAKEGFGRVRLLVRLVMVNERRDLQELMQLSPEAEITT